MPPSTGSTRNRPRAATYCLAPISMRVSRSVQSASDHPCRRERQSKTGNQTVGHVKESSQPAADPFPQLLSPTAPVWMQDGGPYPNANWWRELVAASGQQTSVASCVTVRPARRCTLLRRHDRPLLPRSSPITVPRFAPKMPLASVAHAPPHSAHPRAY